MKKIKFENRIKIVYSEWKLKNKIQKLRNRKSKIKIWIIKMIIKNLELKLS